MSHAYGKVFFKDGHVLHYEYDGTSDVVLNPLHDTAKEVFNLWRQYKPVRYCTCGLSEPVFIYTDYGFGFYWRGRACRHCKLVTDGFEPFDIEDVVHNHDRDKTGEPTKEDLKSL